MASESNSRYAVPVYEFRVEGSDKPQLASESDDTTVLVKHTERQYGDPEINVTFVKPEETERFRFRITDEETQWCSYRGDPSELTVAVQHAVHAFGYGITELESLSNRLFEWMELRSVLDEVQDIHDDYSDWELFRSELNDTVASVYDLTSLLLARYAMSSEGYWGAWRTYLDTNQHDDLTRSSWIQGPLWELTLETMTAEQLGRDNDRALSMIIQVTDLETTGGQYIQADFLTEFGSQRFQFQTTGKDTCVFQKPNHYRVPPGVVKAVNAEGYAVTNVGSVEQTSSDREVCEQAAMLCQQLRSRDIVNFSWETTAPIDPVNAAYENLTLIASMLKLIEVDEATTREIHDRILAEGGVDVNATTDPTQLSQLLGVLVELLPDALQKEMYDYLESHPAHELPEEADYLPL